MKLKKFLFINVLLLGLFVLFSSSSAHASELGQTSATISFHQENSNNNESENHDKGPTDNSASNNNSIQENVSTNKLPQTGEKKTSISSIGILLLLLSFVTYRYKKVKEVVNNA